MNNMGGVIYLILKSKYITLQFYIYSETILKIKEIILAKQFTNAYDNLHDYKDFDAGTFYGENGREELVLQHYGLQHYA